jgi:CheY-like chemotaxis protein
MNDSTDSPRTALILVIDDDEQVNLFVGTCLREAGYAVVTASNGREAMALVRSQPPELVITDILMPDQEGIETILQLRRDYPRISIIAITGEAGRTGDMYLRHAGMLGADRVLRKPFPADALLREVGDVLRTARLTPPAYQ